MLPERSQTAGGYARAMAHLPYGVARLAGGDVRCVARDGDRVIDLDALDLPVPPGTFAQPALNGFLALGAEAWAATADRLEELAPGAPGAAVGELVLPLGVGDYVAFYSSRFHAENVSRLLRPDAEPLLPN